MPCHEGPPPIDNMCALITIVRTIVMCLRQLYAVICAQPREVTACWCRFSFLSVVLCECGC